MRMWMVDPRIMCRQHLLGEHVELHMLVGHLQRGRRVEKFVAHNCVQPRAIARRHRALVREMQRRGYTHRSPLTQPVVGRHQRPTARVDAAEALKDLMKRCVECRRRNRQKMNDFQARK